MKPLLAQNPENQHEITTQISYQVRKAIEILVQKLDKIDKDYKSNKNNNFKLTSISEKRLYEAALTVMIRLAFLFSAEERGLLLLGDPFFDNHYAVSILRTKLREVADQHGEEALECRSDAWIRLLGTFRAVYSGIEQESFRLPAYGGYLFDPDGFAFLEGRKDGNFWLETGTYPLPVDNRTVLHLLEALQILQVEHPSGKNESYRLSFCDLDVEQIGHIYEGLLDYTAIRAINPVLRLEGIKEPEVLLEKLEQLRLKGESDLLEFLKNETGKSLSTLKRLLALTISPQDEQKFIVACDNDQALWSRVQPFAGLVCKDIMGYPIVINSGSIYVTQGQGRRSTGTHYTPYSLTKPIVQYTLEPLCYVGVAEGKPKEKWQLKSASELLKLKVCDFAMGSGAFLIEACRYLAERLVEAWKEAERTHPRQFIITPEGALSKGQCNKSLIPKDPTERMLTAKRIVADRCIYGVDINPMAVEMAKLSLWLVTMQKNRPFTFVDHSLKCGDSLLGVTDPKQIEYFSLQPEKKTQSESIKRICKPLLETAIAKRKELESFIANDIQAIQRKEKLFLEAKKALDKIRLLGDLLVGEQLRNISKPDMTVTELEEIFREVTDEFSNIDSYQKIKAQALYDKAKRLLGQYKPFHWLLEFPEVFWQEDDKGGFDAIVGNPPFMGGSKITSTLGRDYRDFIVKQLAKGKRGNADFCAYFFLRLQNLINPNGGAGLLATNTIAQGDTREVGLEQLIKWNWTIHRAIASQKWPGIASLQVAYIWLKNGFWKNEYVLNNQQVTSINAFLATPGKTFGSPQRLVANLEKSFTGNKVYGEGFVLSLEQADYLVKKDFCNNEVIFGYLNGEDLYSSLYQSPSRSVINFGERNLDQASNYPDCLEIIKKLVKPYRDMVSNEITRKNWWLHERSRPELYTTIAGKKRVLVKTQISRTWAFCFVKPNIVFDQRIIVFSISDYWGFSLLQSEIHWVWAIEFSSSLKQDMSYNPSDAFQTFPFPKIINLLERIGEKYYNYRQSIMLNRQEGLTKTYNRFHNPNEASSDITKLRQLQVEMDNTVAKAYGWADLDLRHGFYQTKQGIRYTICQRAYREVLDRLLELNHQRYIQEVAAKLHDISKGKKKSISANSKGNKKAKTKKA